MSQDRSYFILLVWFLASVVVKSKVASLIITQKAFCSNWCLASDSLLIFWHTLFRWLVVNKLWNALWTFHFSSIEAVSLVDQAVSDFVVELLATFKVCWRSFTLALRAYYALLSEGVLWAFANNLFRWHRAANSRRIQVFSNMMLFTKMTILFLTIRNHDLAVMLDPWRFSRTSIPIFANLNIAIKACSTLVMLTHDTVAWALRSTVIEKRQLV